MAFCNSCGATLAEGTKFCSKCGATVSANPSGMSTARPVQAPLPAPPPSKGGSSALKIILIIVGVVVLLGVLGIATVGFIGYRIAKSAKVSQNGQSVKVESPFFNMDTSPETVAKELGVEVYPGAEPIKGMTSSATIANIHTASGFYTTTDTPDKVCDFYKTQLPSANVTSADTNRCNLVSSNPPKMITVNVQSNDGGSKIQITNVTKKIGAN